jgi:hypothetical protein
VKLCGSLGERNCDGAIWKSRWVEDATLASLGDGWALYGVCDLTAGDIGGSGLLGVFAGIELSGARVSDDLAGGGGSDLLLASTCCRGW